MGSLFFPVYGHEDDTALGLLLLRHPHSSAPSHRDHLKHSRSCASKSENPFRINPQLLSEQASPPAIRFPLPLEATFPRPPGSSLSHPELCGLHECPGSQVPLSSIRTPPSTTCLVYSPQSSRRRSAPTSSRPLPGCPVGPGPPARVPLAPELMGMAAPSLCAVTAVPLGQPSLDLDSEESTVFTLCFCSPFSDPGLSTQGASESIESWGGE